LYGSSFRAWIGRTTNKSLPVRGSGSTAIIVPEMVAFGQQCTHLGCAHHWDDAKSQFVCPCHNSLFAIDGTVAYGPAPRPLDRYETKLEGSKLLVGNLRRPEGTGV